MHNKNYSFLALVAGVLVFGLAIFLSPKVQAGSVAVTGATFTKYSGASFASTAASVANYRTKSVQVTGHKNTTTAASGVFENFSGTVLVQCAATSSGPWNTCVQQDGTAISFTAPGVLSWDDAFPFVRINWAKTKKMISVWVYGNDK